MKLRFKNILKLLLIGGFFLGATTHLQAAPQEDKIDPNKVFYRYTTEQGNKVISQTMPPQYVRNGYEMVSISGEVLKVVPPAPPEADAERISKEKKAAKEQAKYDAQLRRTYSTASDIEGAKMRNLQELRNTINILDANLVSVRSQLKNQETLAATIERNGKTVTDDVLKNINTLRAEEKDVNAQIKQREQEYQQASDKYDQDKQRFIEITSTKK